MAQRVKGRLIFDCPSPSVWLLVGAPITLAFDGAVWVLSMTDRDGFFREGRFFQRDDAIQFIAKAFGTGKKAS